MTESVFYFTDSTGFGGAERVALSLLSKLNRQRWRPVLLYHESSGIQPLVESARQLGVDTRAVPPMRGRAGAKLLPQFAWQLRAEHPAVFHAHLTMPLACKYALAGAALARVPAILATEHLFVNVPWRYSIWVEQLVAKGVDRYLAVSRLVARRLQSVLALPAQKLRVVHNGISLAPFLRESDSQLRAELRGNDERPLVLTTARLERQKGLTFLLDAAAQVSNAKFVIAGEGPERSALEQKARELGIAERVLFLGARRDIADLVWSCDVFVLPSLFEGLPLSVLEAMAARKPVISTDVGGTTEAVIDGETGLVVPPANVDALASALRALLADPTRAQQFGRAGQLRVHQEFSAERMTQRVEEIYDELLSAKRL